MKKLMTFALVCLVILGLPAYAFDGDEADVWPCFFGTDNAGPDNGYMSFYDQDADAFQAPRLIDNDLLAAQWTPQRQGIGNDTTGKYNVSFIEATGNDLEIWESPDDGWQDDAGAWAMTDNDASNNWLAVDVETRQNYVWALPSVAGVSILCYYIDLAAAVPNWAAVANVLAADSVNYSCVLNYPLNGYVHFAFVTGGNVTSGFASRQIDGILGITTILAGGYPQVVSCGSNFIHVFFTVGNILQMQSQMGYPELDLFSGSEIVYTATTLTDNYHATWLAADDSIHVVLVDYDEINPNSTILVYMRRIPNGWSAPITLLTVDSRPLGDIDSIEWPQITVGPNKSIFIHYILDTDWADPAVGGDLQGFHLDLEDYADYITPATWTQHVNIDQSADNILWVVARDSEVIYQDI